MNLLLSGFCESLEATEMMWIVNLHHHSRWASWQNKEVWPLSFFQVQENGVERSLGNGHMGFDNSRTLIMRGTSERDIGLHETDFWVKTIFEQLFETSQPCQVYRVNIGSIQVNQTKIIVRLSKLSRGETKKERTIIISVFCCIADSSCERKTLNSFLLQLSPLPLDASGEKS